MKKTLKKNEKHQKIYILILIILSIGIMGAFSIPYIIHMNETKVATGEQTQINNYIGYFDEDDSEQNKGDESTVTGSEPLDATTPTTNKELSLEERENLLDEQLKTQTNNKRKSLSKKDFYNTLTVRQKEIYDNPLSEKGEWLPPFED